MSLQVKDKNRLKNHDKIWNKTEESMNINFNSKPTYGEDDKYIKTKIKSYKDSVTTNFPNKKVPKEEIRYKCLSMIILDSALYAYEKYHPQTFLEEFKQAQKKIKTKSYISEELKSESDTITDTDTDIDNDE